MTKFERFIMNKTPFGWLLKQTKKVHLPGSSDIPLYDVIIFFIKQVKRIGFNERAAAISFNFMMAIPAGMIFLFTLVPYLPVAQQFHTELNRTLKEILLNQKTFELIRNIVDDIWQTKRSGLLSTSFVAALFFASNAMMGVMRTFDRSFFEERKRKFMYKRWTAIKLTFLLLVLVFVSILILSTQGSLRKVLTNNAGMDRSVVLEVVKSLRWVIVALLNFFSIAFIYRFATAVKIRWKVFSPGAIFACLLTISTSYVFSLWVNSFGRFNQVYGSLGTVLIIMNLIYINALILLIGFEINVSITTIKAKSVVQQNDEYKNALGQNAAAQETINILQKKN